MPTLVAFLACETTLPGSATRHDDAHEHDLEVAALTGPLATRGIGLVPVDWADPSITEAGFAGAVIGTAWNYELAPDRFVSTLRALARAGTPVWNDPDLVEWNVHKGYLRWLDDAGVRVLPTVWIDDPTVDAIEAARTTLGHDDIVVKRQVGAGGRGQERFRPGEPVAWADTEPVLVQAFEPAIEDEGEWSMVFVDGVLSHAVVKQPAPGDYRIQSLYGGVEAAATPTPEDRNVAARALAAAPGGAPLYARVDLVRRADGELAVMELELIEPYLYPEQGPGLGPRYADALLTRLR